MKGQSVVFSKGKDNWRTPREVFEPLDEEFHFVLDVAADVTNSLTPQWFGLNSPLGPIGDDALTTPNWSVMNWCNPPYSKVKEFISKAADERLKGHRTVMLVPARTDTKWFHEHIYHTFYHKPRPGVEIRFLKGRVKFIDPVVKYRRSEGRFVGPPEELRWVEGDILLDDHGQPIPVPTNSAPFPSMVVIFG